MDTITIDGVDEHDFRHAIEDMLRADDAESALVRLRALLEPHAAHGGILPPRFLEVAVRDLQIAGWHRLADRLLNHDRRGFPISAIGVVLSDARKLGGPKATNGWLAPFVKTFYFSDEAYPFTDATRDDLLDGYSRDGFGWQGDYQATDATLSIKGIDDLYGSVVALEDRVLDSKDPSEDEIRAGTLGACYLAALIYQALRETIRAKGLPRPLCVLAACDGVYPFFDAPVAGQDESMVAVPAEADEELAASAEEAGEWDAEAEEAAPLAACDSADLPSPEGSLLGLISRKGTKSMVLTLDEGATEDALRYTEMAAAQRMAIEDESKLQGVLAGRAHDASLTFEREPIMAEGNDLDRVDEPEPAAPLLDNDLEVPSEFASPLGFEPIFVEPGEPVIATAASNSFRARLRPVAEQQQQARRPRGSWAHVIKDWLMRLLGQPERQF